MIANRVAGLKGDAGRSCWFECNRVSQLIIPMRYMGINLENDELAPAAAVTRSISASVI